MGLAAVVYRSVSSLEAQFGAGAFEVEDAATGEAAPKADLSCAVPNDAHEAEYRRLGNISQIGWLRERVAAILGAGSLTERKVLYSGSHCGDWIELTALDELRSEIDAVNAATQGEPDADVAEFLASMSALLLAAKREGNPIVFT